TLVAKAIADALHVVENLAMPLLETLKSVLAGQQMLLVVDNFEHVIDAAPVLSELLVASENVKMLVTSGEALRLSGDQEYPVSPLSLPSLEGDAVQNVMDSESGLLFIQRLHKMLPDYEVNNDNASAIAQICVRLDGLPLAIELAAARGKLLP